MAPVGETRNAYKEFYPENAKGRNHMGDLGVCGTKILK
jgi:hypothetical protein